MEYTCIKTLNKIGKGFITTRAPKIIEKELIISFLGAPQGATAIFENSNGHSLYRLLADKSCVIPSDFLVGEITVTIVQLDGSSDAEKYHCRLRW